MYCSNCGKEIADNAVICVHCGCATKNYQPAQQNKTFLCAILLCLFLGAFGAHRFYLGHKNSGIVMLICFLTAWLIIPGIILGFWWLVDIILLISGNLRPKDGSQLV